MRGERAMARNGYRWDVVARFVCNAAGVRVGTRKTKRGAELLAKRFARINRGLGVEYAHVRLRHDPLLDEAMNKRGSR